MIKRTIFNNLKAHLIKKEISLIVGPRQAGKTTLMLLLKEYLEGKKEKTLFLNLDVEQDKQFFISQSVLIKKIELEFGRNKGFVFLDEIQRKENAGLFLKGIYDLNLPYKFIVSGSGSVELKEKIHESLSGRKLIFELPTLNFEEFINFKTDYKYENKLDKFFEIEKERIFGFLDEYLNFGGYPRVVLSETLEEKRRIINEIYQSYLEKDASFLLRIKKTDDFSHLLKLTASQIGNLVNFTELASTLGIASKTVKEYLWYLEKTFIIKKNTPYFRNIRKEITKSPVYYFYDFGLRNHALGIFGNVSQNTDRGFLFQNFVFNALGQKLDNSSAEIHFWRTKDGGEVDFILESGKECLPIEVKYKKFKNPEITRSFRNFIDKYAPRKAFIINLELEKTIILHKTKIHFLPFYKIGKVLQ